MSATTFMCTVCGRGYDIPGTAWGCHPDTQVSEILVSEVRARLKQLEEEQRAVEEAEEARAAEVNTLEGAETDARRAFARETTDWGDTVSTYQTGAKRANGGKLRYDLLPILALRDTAQAFTFGSAKYGDRNWEKGFDWSGPYASLMRHLNAWFQGEDFDAESGLSHLSHAACNLMMLQQFEYTHRQGDNRPGAGQLLPLRRAPVPEPETAPPAPPTPCEPEPNASSLQGRW